MTAALATAIYTRLKAVSAVTDLVGGASAPRVYAGQAPQNATAPYAVWWEIATQPQTTHGNAAGAEDTLDETLVQFTCLAGTLSEALELRSAIRAALVVPGAMSGIVVTPASAREDFEEAVDLHRADLDLTIFHNPTA